jgi:hypothetical protein
VNCQELRERIVDPSSATQGGHAPVVEHLQECAACRSLARDFAAIERLLRAAPEVEPPPDFDERVRARMARATPAERALARIGTRRVAGAAAVVLGLVLAGLLIRKSPAPAPAASPAAPASPRAATPTVPDARPPEILAVHSTPISLETAPLGDEERQRILALENVEFLGFVETLERLTPLFPAEIGPVPPRTPAAAPPRESDEAKADRLADWRAASPEARARWMKLEEAYASRPFAERQVLVERWRRVRGFTLGEKAGLKRLAARLSEMDEKRRARFESEVRAMSRLAPPDRRLKWRSHPFVQTLTGQEIASGERLLLPP